LGPNVSPAERRRDRKRIARTLRSRDTKAAYQRRKARAAEKGTSVYGERVARGADAGLSATQAAGHPKAGEPTALAAHSEPRWTVTLLSQPRDVVTVHVPRRDAVRAGKYNALLRGLREGRVTPAEFRARAARMKPIAGHRPISDPRKALALLILIEPNEWLFDSPRAGGRSRRR
jgi:hypothetical protein